METTININSITQQINCPAFTVKDGIITWTNYLAEALGIQKGAEVYPYIYSGAKDYQRFTEGTMYVTINSKDIYRNASVFRFDDADAFILDSDFIEPLYRQLEHLATRLRTPLMEAIGCAEYLSSSKDPGIVDCLSQLKHSLFRISNSLSNMTDPPNYKYESIPLIANQCVTKYLENIVGCIAPHIQNYGYKIKTNFPNRDIYCPMDHELLKKAFINMLSNAMRFTKRSKSIHVIVKKHGDYCTISVRNFFIDKAQMDRFDNFNAFSHDVIYEKESDGLGFGMTVIRTAAAIHGGAVLITRPTEDTLQVTLSIPASEHGTNKNNKLRQDSVLPNDIYDYHNILAMLADVLPPEAFK